MVAGLIHNVPFLIGVSLTALALGGRVPLITGIVLIVAGLYFR